MRWSCPVHPKYVMAPFLASSAVKGSFLYLGKVVYGRASAVPTAPPLSNARLRSASATAEPRST